MRVLGIDPGSTVTGFGVVESRRGRILLVEAGCIRTQASEPMGERLARIHDGLVEAMRRTNPDGVAIESIFRHKSSESALRLGQARGVALLAAAQAGHEAVPYNPSTVKATVGASGRADKRQMTKMVELLLGVPVEGPADVADAVAIAITHLTHHRSGAAAATSRKRRGPTLAEVAEAALARHGRRR